MNKFSKYLIWGLIVGFLLLGVNAFLKSKPETKSPRIYKEIKKYSPYYLDKRVTGLDIKSRENKEFKESPDSFKVFHRLDTLEQAWGKKHLRVKDTTLTVLDNNGSILTTIPLQNRDEVDFIHRFYGI
jgi:hypothetical protein